MQKIITAITIFLVPILFFTTTPNYFNTPKQLLLITSVLAITIGYAVNIFTSKSLTLSRSSLRFGLSAFGIIILLNLILNPIARVESILGPASIYLALCAWSYLLTLNSGRSAKSLALYSFLGSTTLLALHTLSQITFLYKLSSLPEFMQSRAFSLTGNPLFTATMILFGTIISIYLSLKNTKFTPLMIVSTIIHSIAFIALSALLLPGGELALSILPYSASWSVTLDAMKTVKTMLFGVGLVNFTNFFTSVKPLFLNTTTFWNSNPSSASSELLQIVTTTGILGLLSFISLPLLSLKSQATTTETIALKILLLLSLASLVLTPSSIPVLFIFFTTIGLLSSDEPVHKPLTPPGHLIVSLIILGITATIAYYSYRVYLGEVHMRQAQQALVNNDGKSLYEHSLKAVETIPQLTSYRLSYAQVNLSLATALSQKESLSDAEKENITQLVSQAVREGKLAINLSPNNPSVWQNMGSIYQKLINVAEGSDQFAIEAYAQAVKLDPANPALRVEFGGLLYQIAQISKKPEDQTALYSRAQSEFQTAIQLKPDYANAYYNLAKLLESIKDYSNAASVMEKAISLLGPNSPDLSKANAELETIKTNVPKPSSTPAPSPAGSNSTVISTPSPLPSPLDGGPIPLPSANE